MRAIFSVSGREYAWCVVLVCSLYSVRSVVCVFVCVRMCSLVRSFARFDVSISFLFRLHRLLLLLSIIT